MFGLDWRSLALLRIGLALVILADLWVSAQNLRAFYTDDGVLPRQLVEDNFPSSFCVHLWGGSFGFEAGLFALEAACALMMLVGYRTRLATVAGWFLLVSRQARNPLVQFGADMIERLAMFWAMMLPLNRRYSVDAALGRVPATGEPSYLGVAGFCAIVQFLLIYVMSALMKTGPTWQTEHSAVYYALSLEMYARPLGQWFNQFDPLTTFLTVYTLYLEFFGPFLLVSPVARKWTRLLGIALLGSLQLGFGICMQMGLFWVATDVFLLMFVPAEFWSELAEPVGRKLAGLWKISLARGKLSARVATEPPPATAWRRRATRGLGWLRDGALLVVLAGAVAMNIGILPGHSKLLPPREFAAMETLGLDQGFGMFAPDPQMDDGWFVIRGWEQNGRSVNVLTGASPATLAKPADVPATYIDQRWGSLFFDFIYPEYSKYLEGTADYLAEQWDETHPDNENLQSIEIIFMHQVVGPHHTKSAPVVDPLWSETF